MNISKLYRSVPFKSWNVWGTVKLLLCALNLSVTITLDSIYIEDYD